MDIHVDKMKHWIQKIIDKDNRLGDVPQQADIFKFKLDEEWLVLKIYKMWENNASAILPELSHPNIVKCYGVGRYKNREWLIMEYLEGMNVDQQGFITEEQTQQLKSTLAYLQEKGVKHHEFKPEHLIINNGIIKLIDFGMASTPEYPLKVNMNNLETNKEYGTNDIEAVELIIKKYSVKT